MGNRMMSSILYIRMVSPLSNDHSLTSIRNNCDIDPILIIFRTCPDVCVCAKTW